MANSQEMLRQTVFQLLSHNQRMDELVQEINSLQDQDEKFRSNLVGVGCVPLLVEKNISISRSASNCQATDQCIERLLQASELEADNTLNIDMIKHLIQDGSFLMSRFHDNMCKQPEISIQLLWTLHQEGILSFDTYIAKGLLRKDMVNNFCSKLFHVYQQVKYRDSVTGILSECIQLVYGELGDKSSRTKLAASTIIDGFILSMVDWILEKSEDKRDLTVTSLWNVSVSMATMKKCCSHILTLILTYKPVLKVSQAMREQHNWSYGKISVTLAQLYKQLLLPYEMSEILTVLQQIMEQQEVNWQLLLSFVSVTVVCLSESSKLFLDYLEKLLHEGLDGCDIESTITGMLLARQACFQGPHVFMSYADWFQKTFSDSTKSLASTRKSFTFLMKFLTDLMPYESAQHIKVHILRPPFVPHKCRPLLSDYIMLAKTRLQDLKESIELMGIEEGTTSAEQSKGKTDLSTDIESVVKLFASTGRIPTSIMEASIFRKPYYIGQFLPALLTPRPLPDFPDAKMKLIAALKSADKLPMSLLNTYEKACRKEAAQLLEGVCLDSDSGEEMELSDLELLDSGLQQLAGCISGCKTKLTVIELISVVCERLEAVLSVSPRHSMDTIPIVTLNHGRFSIPEHQLKVVDLLLNALTDCVQICYKIHHPTFTWLTWLLQALVRYDIVMETLYKRFWILLVTQNSCLEKHHIDCLAAILVELQLLGNQVPWLQLDNRIDGADRSSFTVAVVDCLYMRTKEEMTFTLRLCSSCMKYLLCSKDSLEMLQTCPNIIKKFTYLATRLEPSLRYHGDTTVPDVAMDTDNCVKVIYRTEPVQEIITAIPLTPSDWAGYEMDIRPDQDAITDIERHGYYRWIVYHYFLQQTIHGCHGYRDIAASLLTQLVMTKCSSHCNWGCKLCKRDETQKTISNSRYQLICLLQELCRMFTYCTRTAESDTATPWLQEQLYSLLQHCTDNIQKQDLVQSFFRVSVCLPAHLMFTDVPATLTPDSDEMECAVNVINNILVEHYSEGIYLPADITVYFTQGLLEGSQRGHLSDMFHLLSSKCLVFTTSMLINHHAVWPMIWKIPGSEDVEIVNIIQHLRKGDVSVGPVVKDTWVHAVCILAHLVNSSLNKSSVKDVVRQATYHGSEQAIIKLAEMSILQLAYEHNLVPDPRIFHIQRLSSALLEVLVDADRSIVGHLLSESVDTRTCACCNSTITSLRQFTLLRCLAGNKACLQADIYHHADTLTLLLSAYSKVTHLFDDGMVPDKTVQDTHLLVLNDIHGFMIEVVTSTPVSILQQIDQELLLNCGPGITDVAIRQLS